MSNTTTETTEIPTTTTTFTEAEILEAILDAKWEVTKAKIGLLPFLD